MKLQKSAIGTPSQTRDIMSRHKLGTKKSLGQNFLIDQNILHKIVAAADLSHDSGVLEIGPGIGALTEKLAQAAGKVLAVEIDGRLIPVLRDTLSPYPHVEVVHSDILKADLASLFHEHFSSSSEISVVANLPYYITTPIIMKLLESGLPFTHIVVMVQKEVADRMAAKPGGKDYGILSIAVQYYSEVETVIHVPRTVFIPQPNVDSSVIRLSLRKEQAFDVHDPGFFFQVVQASFAQRRKTIHNNLLARFFDKSNKERLLQVLEDCGIEPSSRAETLTLAQFALLSNRLAAETLKEK